jgi:hypothetical protein
MEYHMWLSVKHVQATDNHKLILTFENSEKRSLDISQFLNIGRFSELKDIDEFQKVHISFDTIEWKNGLDLDPEFLYEKSVRMD